MPRLNRFWSHYVPQRLSSCCGAKSNALKCEMDFLKGPLHSAKEILDILNSYPLDVLADPSNETAIMESLSSLSAHLYLFSDERGKEILNLKATFPEMIQEWRVSVQGKGRRNEHPWSSFEKTRNLLEGLVKKGEGITP
ncbi:unnamed protein product [Cuscuta epithymum]|uniref:Uncharacterized protein n=1 Tax=Cuscuta epithymum TaxID=186058 RepID=A0AAV0EJQ0_9ASTE|nr:unnamed protein product [Cuscuta epithymum]